MKPKAFISGIITAIVAIILFNNREEASFWLFREIHTSKLLILGVFFLLGVITGAILFRRKKRHPKEYNISNPNIEDNLSEEDRQFLGRDNES